MFKVKPFQHIKDLLLEADMIIFDDQVDNISMQYDPTQKSSDSTNGQDPNFESYDKFDILIDGLLDRGIIDLNTDLNSPIFERVFTSERGKQLVTAYLDYCAERITKLKVEYSQEANSEVPNKNSLESIMIVQITIAARIEALDKIYAALKKLQQPEAEHAANEVNQKIVELKQILVSAYSEPISEAGAKIKSEINNMENGKTNEEKLNSAKIVLDQFDTLKKVIELYPSEAKQGYQQARNIATQTIKNQVGAENLEQIEQEILSNDHEATVLRRILDLRYMNFTSEDEIYKQADGIKISINGLRNPKGKPRSKPEVIAYLEKQLAEVSNELLKKARDKSISIDQAKGIHYNFEVKLKLHEMVDLPVTAKQMADAHIVMKLRKRLAAIINLFVMGGSLPVTAASQAFGEFGAATHKMYAVALNSSAKLIGRIIGGKEGQLKADAFSRLLIPIPDVLDKQQGGYHGNPELHPVPKIQLNEEGSPGVAMQTPDSISGAGPIVAPTRTSYGSGDRFSSHKKKKKKFKPKKLNEDCPKVLDFSSFVNENKDM